VGRVNGSSRFNGGSGLNGNLVREHSERHFGWDASDRLVAFERNIEYQMSENLKQAGGDQALEVPVKIEARLRQQAHVYDLRAGTYLGLTNRIHFTLDAFQPSLFALLPEEVRPHSVLERLEREL